MYRPQWGLPGIRGKAVHGVITRSTGRRFRLYRRRRHGDSKLWTALYEIQIECHISVGENISESGSYVRYTAVLSVLRGKRQSVSVNRTTIRCVRANRVPTVESLTAGCHTPRSLILEQCLGDTYLSMACTVTGQGCFLCATDCPRL